MFAEHFRLVRFDLEVQGQGQTRKMANNLVYIASTALECNLAPIGKDVWPPILTPGSTCSRSNVYLASFCQ